MLLYSLLAGGFLVITGQDFKERAISLWTLPFILLLGVYSAWSSVWWEPWFLFFNLSFVGVQLLGVSLYFSIKHKTWINITQAHLGLGDILFFLVITPLFAPVQFCCFFIGSLLFILLLAGAYHVWIRAIETIPLAGAMSGCWLLYTAFLAYYNLSSYDDWSLLKLLYG